MFTKFTIISKLINTDKLCIGKIYTYSDIATFMNIIICTSIKKKEEKDSDKPISTNG